MLLKKFTHIHNFCEAGVPISCKLWLLDDQIIFNYVAVAALL